jgi:hypothetical protein
MLVAWSDVIILLYSVTDARSYQVALEIFHTIQNNLFTYVSKYDIQRGRAGCREVGIATLKCTALI